MKRERGFTLIELLVVIAILGVLFGLTALALNGLYGKGDPETKAAELDMVQTAIDVYMAVNKTDTITATTTAKKVGPGSGDPFSTYLRRETKYCYTWTGVGVASQAACP